MNKKPLAALSVVGLIALVLSTGSVVAQDPSPTLGLPTPLPIPEVVIPQSPQQPEATTGMITFAMSHQGQLQKSGVPHNGTCNFQFSLWDAATGGTQIQSTLTKNNIVIASGLFSVELDFGFGYYFTGDARWLQTAVQCAGDSGFTMLSPRQPLNAVPYALGLRPGAVVSTTDGYAIDGRSRDSVGVHGSSVNFFGFAGGSVNGIAGLFESQKGDGLWGFSNAAGKTGVYGLNRADGNGVVGVSKSGVGVKGESTGHDGVQGISHAGDHAGVYGFNDTSEPRASGVAGVAPNGNGVFGGSENFSGGYFYSKNGIGVVAASDNHDGIQGTSHAAGRSGVYGANDNPNGFAAFFVGKTWTKVLEIAGGSDLAERFSQADGTVAEPGTVMVIDPDNPGQIKSSAGAYDRKVAGIVSGAGDIRPGLTLHQEGVAEGDTVMAIAGRVYVKAEALSGAIEPGDLLTTSDLPGYAMKASDPSRSHGAVIGKAMTGLKEGKGLVLVIVNLQ
jgi:hypothetical protein